MKITVNLLTVYLFIFFPVVILQYFDKKKKINNNLQCDDV